MTLYTVVVLILLLYYFSFANTHQDFNTLVPLPSTTLLSPAVPAADDPTINTIEDPVITARPIFPGPGQNPNHGDIAAPLLRMISSSQFFPEWEERNDWELFGAEYGNYGT